MSVRNTWRARDLDDPKQRKEIERQFRDSGRKSGLWPQLEANLKPDGRLELQHRTETGNLPGAEVSIYWLEGVYNPFSLRVQAFPGRFVEATLVYDRKFLGETVLRGQKNTLQLTFWTTVEEKWERNLKDLKVDGRRGNGRR